MAKTLHSVSAVMRDITRFMERSVDAVIKESINTAKSLTPVRTGRAQRGWTKRDYLKLGSSTRTIVIENRVPYIGILDRRNPIIKPAIDRAVYMTRRSN